MKEDQKIAIYQTEDGQTQIDVRLENETVWLNVAQMASLFMKEESNVRRHVLNAFKEGELERSDNNVHFLHVNGVKKPLKVNVVQLSAFGLARLSKTILLRAML